MNMTITWVVAGCVVMFLIIVIVGASVYAYRTHARRSAVRRQGDSLATFEKGEPVSTDPVLRLPCTADFSTVNVSQSHKWRSAVVVHKEKL